MIHIVRLPGNVLELLPEGVVEPAVQDRVGEGGRHSDQVAHGEHHAVELVNLNEETKQAHKYKGASSKGRRAHLHVAHVEHDVEDVEREPGEGEDDDDGHEQGVRARLLPQLLAQTRVLDPHQLLHAKGTAIIVVKKKRAS